MIWPVNDLHRREILLAAVMLSAGAAHAAGKTAWDFKFTSIEGGVLDLASFKGRALLVVNTASFCGFTYQYEALEKLHKDMTAQGLTVVGIPSQDFNQESADSKTVKQFCDATFGVEFPMSEIAHVRGAQADPFYQWLKAERKWEPGWNFCKVVIGRDGAIVDCFGSADEPTGMRVAGAIKAALAVTA